MDRRDLLKRLGAVGLAIPATIAMERTLVPQLIEAAVSPWDYGASYQDSYAINLGTGDALQVTMNLVDSFGNQVGRCVATVVALSYSSLSIQQVVATKHRPTRDRIVVEEKLIRRFIV
jgi:hypothetical protein